MRTTKILICAMNLKMKYNQFVEIMNKYNIGEIVEDYSPDSLVKKLNEMLSNSEKTEVWKGNMQKAKKELNWENEQKKLIEIYCQFL